MELLLIAQYNWCGQVSAQMSNVFMSHAVILFPHAESQKPPPLAIEKVSTSLYFIHILFIWAYTREEKKSARVASYMVIFKIMLC